MHYLSFVSWTSLVNNKLSKNSIEINYYRNELKNWLGFINIFLGFLNKITISFEYKISIQSSVERMQLLSRETIINPALFNTEWEEFAGKVHDWTPYIESLEGNENTIDITLTARLDLSSLLQCQLITIGFEENQAGNYLSKNSGYISGTRTYLYRIIVHQNDPPEV